MAPKKKGKNKGKLDDLLGGLGLHGNYSLLIDRAVRNDWDAQEFLSALVKTKAFRQSFPGLLTNGRINDFLANGRDTISASNIGAAITNYKRMKEAYQDIAEERGLTAFKINGRRMRQLLNAEVSPDEFGQRAVITSAVNRDPSLKAWYDAVRKEAGLKPVDKAGLFKDILKKDSTFYDLHEAAKLGQSGLFDAQEALKLAKGIGIPGQMTDIDETIRLTKENIADIGPELERQGISSAKLFSFLQNPGADPDNLLPKIQGLIANRRALGQQQGGGGLARQGSGGGLATYRESESQSY
jgi:hypothetical protein